MNLDAINNRVDGALKDNRRAEHIVIGMAVGIFMLGAGILVVAYWLTNPYVSSGTVLFSVTPLLADSRDSKAETGQPNAANIAGTGIRASAQRRCN